MLTGASLAASAVSPAGRKVPALKPSVESHQEDTQEERTLRKYPLLTTVGGGKELGKGGSPNEGRIESDSGVGRLLAASLPLQDTGKPFLYCLSCAYQSASFTTIQVYLCLVQTYFRKYWQGLRSNICKMTDSKFPKD